MSIERGPSQITVKSYFLVFLTIYSISNKSRYTIGKALKIMFLMKKWLEDSQGLSSYGGFSFEKRLFSETTISRSKADFDPRPPPRENMDLLIAVYTHFRG
jgi:hypothetical protein